MYIYIHFHHIHNVNDNYIWYIVSFQQIIILSLTLSVLSAHTAKRLTVHAFLRKKGIVNISVTDGALNISTYYA